MCRSRFPCAGWRNAKFMRGRDEDQALYRFRGATVRNILEFHAKSEDAEQ
jgi:superfamily I DNA/RNA helicase